MKCEDEIKLVFPTKKYKDQVEEFLQEHFDNGEYEINGDGGLDTIRNFDDWLNLIKNDLFRKENEERVPATMYLGVRTKDNRVVGILQIRHILNEELLKYGGHIGYNIRPSERRKGYVSKMLELALKECKGLNINRVLLCCDKTNIGSQKAIIKNGGVLENEIVTDHIIQRYWISLKKRYADSMKDFVGVEKIEHYSENFDDEDFKGDVYLNYISKVSIPFVLPKGLKILDNDYKYLEFYDYSKRVKLSAVYNEKNEIIEWYFDIAREIGIENGIPYEDDMYLDVVLTPNGKVILLDEDEFEDAYKRYEFTKEEYDDAYKIRNDLVKYIEGKNEDFLKFSNKYLKLLLKFKG